MFEKLFNLIFPNVCGFCGKINADYACKMCRENLKYICGGNLLLPYVGKHFDGLIFAYRYEGIVKKRILEFKFFNKKFLYRALSIELFLKLKPYKDFFDVIIPVPIHWKKFLNRGYNQSYLIAKFLSLGLNISVKRNVLRKIFNNKSQTSFSESDRFLNVRGVYSVSNAVDIKDRCVLLVDDVFTTGATVDECSRVLKVAGAKKVFVATIAKTGKQASH